MLKCGPTKHRTGPHCTTSYRTGPKNIIIISIKIVHKVHTKKNMKKVK